MAADRPLSSRPVGLRRLKWSFIAMLAALLAMLYYARYLLAPFPTSLKTWLITDAVVVVSVIFVFGAALTVLARVQEGLERRHRELLALHGATVDVCSELALDTVLQKVVEEARDLIGARYGAIAVYDDGGGIEQFLVSGIDPEIAERIGDPPKGRGLLGIVLDEGERLRLTDIAEHPRAVGLPREHPPMKALLAIPIVCQHSFRGNLYLAQSDDQPFTDEDEESLTRFATIASLAIDNAHIHEQLRALTVAEERVRIAREMHDGLAQVLAYVNTKAQAVKEFMRQDKGASAAAQLEQLAAASRDVYLDVREQIFGLRTGVGPDRSLTDVLPEYVQHWQDQSGIPVELALDPNLQLDAVDELQLLRIVQEALANVRKHSQAKTATIRIHRDGPRLMSSVEDDGTGFDPAAKHAGSPPRFGLAIMRERAESIGGTLLVSSKPGAGTRVEVELPLPQ